jgi:hypothetical protein
MRLMLGDTNSDTFIFEDEELEAFYSLAGSEILSAVAMACRAIAVDASKQAIAYRLLSDAIEIDKTRVPDYFIKLADKIESGIMNEPLLYVDSVQYGVDVFGIESGTEYVGDDEL